MAKDNGDMENVHLLNTTWVQQNIPLSMQLSERIGGIMKTFHLFSTYVE